MEAINHLPFIVASYAAAGIVIAALIAWVLLDYRAQRRALLELQESGVVRRSAAAAGSTSLQRVKEEA